MGMPAELQEMLNTALSQAGSLVKPVQLDWHVKTFGTVDELSNFVNDGKKINNLQVFVFKEKIVVVYGIAK